ncbi:hypothetical protein F4777DRAFT_108202 [Nemania sp. FL0916]|nr:hypothetical protein F4777DRAFT_108202 [Nemania sp. FL0916]
MRTIILSLGMAVMPAAYASQLYIGQDTCPLNSLSLMIGPPKICPSVNIISSYNTTQDRDGLSQRRIAADMESDVWKTLRSCSAKYCIYTNKNFYGEAISVITTAHDRGRIGKIRAPEAISKSDRELAKVVEIPGKGRGLVATRTIRRGERIMASRPAFLVHRDIFREVALEDIYSLVDTAVNSLPTSRKDAYLAQAGTMGGHKALDILFTNAFQISLGEHDGFHYANFPEVSILNHDCRPNLAFFIDKSLTHYTHAVRDIKPGEELTISYLDALQVRSVRQERVQHLLGFSCSCPQCALPKKESDASDRRLFAISQMRDKLSDLQSKGTSLAVIEEYVALYRTERLEHRIAEAYKLAALGYNTLKAEGMAKTYALLSLEAALLESGPEAADVKEMKNLANAPKSHWSWSLKSHD